MKNFCEGTMRNLAGGPPDPDGDFWVVVGLGVGFVLAMLLLSAMFQKG
jgi:hypothetical protein